MKAKKLFTLLLALALCLALAACGGSKDDADTARDYDVLRMTVTTQLQSDNNYTSVQTTEYDTRGLITSIAVSVENEEHRAPVNYSFDEKENPVGVSLELEEVAFSMKLENRYRGDALTEAVVTELVLDGEPLALDDPEGMNALQLSNLTVALRMVQNYTGYRDCTLRVGDSEYCMRYENGRQVYAYSILPDMGQEFITEYGDDGSVRSTQSYYELANGKKSLLNRMSTLTDADLFLREQTVSVSQEGEISFIFRYEDGKDADTGERQRIGYIDELKIPDSMDVSAEQMKEMLKNTPIMLYTLDGKGRVSKSEFGPAFANLMGGAGTTSTNWYNADGKITRYESSTQSQSYSITTVTEYEYR